ncbi:MAG TPA: SDR family oxidoreductase [Azospirillaceae bacterium]|nr:SDR family oxidoreductase [Azospirillaceae bacterium]
MERVLVTGAGGYIGTTLVPLLLENGYKVRAIDRFFFGRHLLPVNDRLETVQEDVRHLAPEHFAGVDYVIDLAAISNDPSGELFQDVTWAVNHAARVRCAELARAAGVRRYLLPSSCSIYGRQPDGMTAVEDTPTNPLTTYAKANERAEQGVLPLADEKFGVIVVRQATVYGYSPRMRMDLAINGMTFGAWKTGKLPLMRDGTQWRPMVHVRDTAEAQMFLLRAPLDQVNGKIFNVGSDENTYRVRDLADTIVRVVSERKHQVEIEWYGDPDLRSYKVGFERIEALGWKAKRRAEDGVSEIVERLEKGVLDRTTETITLEWYKTLASWHERIKQLEMYGGILEVGA